MVIDMRQSSKRYLNVIDKFIDFDLQIFETENLVLILT